MNTVTRESITTMLNNPNPKYVEAVVGRALVALLKNQTATEQATAETKEDNGIGFTGADAFGGTLTAKYYIKHKRLQQWQIDKWLKCGSSGFPRLAKYHKQLAAVAANNTQTIQQPTKKASGKSHRTESINNKLETVISKMADEIRALKD